MTSLDSRPALHVRAFASELQAANGFFLPLGERARSRIFLRKARTRHIHLLFIGLKDP